MEKEEKNEDGDSNDGKRKRNVKEGTKNEAGEEGDYEEEK